jgi:hypothetical protein
LDVFQGRIRGEADTELGAYVLVPVGAMGLSFRNAMLGHVLDSTKIAAEIMDGLGAQRC